MWEEPLVTKKSVQLSSSSRYPKGVALLRQQLDGHGSRQSLRRV